MSCDLFHTERVTGDTNCKGPIPSIDIDPCGPAECVSFEIMTWNLREFPLAGESTLEYVKEVLQSMEPDVVALQEIADSCALKNLLMDMPGWDLLFTNIEGRLDLAFLVNTQEIEAYSTPRIIVENIDPRPAVEMQIRHISGIQAIMINVHLKCCGGQVNFHMRRSASISLKEYIDTNHPGEAVLVLGDYNDTILWGSPFDNFLVDPDNYLFADMSIQNGSPDNWSYPDWPSHLDHILISNELFEYEKGTRVIQLDQCVGYDRYIEDITDHRPLMIVLSH